jgi:hypothetical protein
LTHHWPLIDAPGVLDNLTEKCRWAHFVFYCVVWPSSLSDSLQSKFGLNLAVGSIEISDFGTDVNNRAPLNYSVFTRQAQLGQSIISGGIKTSCWTAELHCHILRSNVFTKAKVSTRVLNLLDPELFFSFSTPCI